MDASEASDIWSQKFSVEIGVAYGCCSIFDDADQSSMAPVSVTVSVYSNTGDAVVNERVPDNTPGYSSGMFVCPRCGSDVNASCRMEVLDGAAIHKSERSRKRLL